MFEIVNGVNGMVLAEIVDRDKALMWAARYADKNNLGRVEILDDHKIVLVADPIDAK